MSLANQLICMMELEGIEIPEVDLYILSRNLNDAIREERFHIFKDGRKWKGFVTWMKREYDGKQYILVSNLVVLNNYKGKVNLWELRAMLRDMYPDIPLIWRNRRHKDKRKFVYDKGGKYVAVYS